MAGEDVILTYGADLSGLKQQLGQLKVGAAEVGSTLAGSLKGLAAGAGIGAAIAAVNGFGYAVQESVTFLRDSVVASLESEQANKRLANAVKNAGESFSFTFEQLKDSASVLQGNSIFSNEQIEAAQKVMIQYRLTGEQFRETQRLALDMAADLGKTPAQAAKILAQSLADPEKAMLRLRLAGISLSESARHQIGELTELGDSYKAQQVLLEDLTKTYAGASAAAADTATGGWAQMKNTLKDLQETLGNTILPYLKEMAPVASELAKLFNDIAKAVAAAFGNTSSIESFKNQMVGLQLVVRGLRLQFGGGGIGDGSADALREKLRGSSMYWKGQNPGDDGLPNGTGPGGAAYRPQGESIGGVRNAQIGFGSGIADGMALAIKQSGVLDTLQTASDSRIAALAEGIKSSIAKPQEGFTSGFEDSVSTFRRIQSSQASLDKVEERQLTALEKLVLEENNKRMRDDTRNTTLLEISASLKAGVPTVLQ